MTGIGRRDTLRNSAAIVIDAAGIRQANAQSTRGSQEETAMEIQRVEIVEPRPGIPILQDIPRISFATMHGNIVYLSGITAHPLHLGDVKDQTRQILERIDQLLAACGTNKSRILTAQVWLTDMVLFADHNAAWNEWVDRASPPVRACLQSPQLWRPGMLVEIMVTAAK